MSTADFRVGAPPTAGAGRTTATRFILGWTAYLKARSTTRRVVGAVTDDQATIDLYFGYAHADRAALWVHTPDRDVASRAMRYLADHDVLHYRYFGTDEQEDIHVR